jgi:hypothetical protein
VAGVCGCESLAPHRHHPAEARHRGTAFAQFQPNRHRSVKRFGQIQHPLAVMLERLAADAAGLLLQRRDQLAVIKGV